jgi:phosphatidylserine synthase
MERYFVILVLVTSALMVSTIEFETMPRFDFSQPRNRIKVLFIMLMAVAVMINASLMIFPFTLIYIVFGVVKLIITVFRGGKKTVGKAAAEKAAIREKA